MEQAPEYPERDRLEGGKYVDGLEGVEVGQGRGRGRGREEEEEEEEEKEKENGRMGEREKRSIFAEND